MILKSDILQMLTNIHSDLEKLEKTMDFSIPNTEAELYRNHEKKLRRAENDYHILDAKFKLSKEQRTGIQHKRTTA